MRPLRAPRDLSPALQSPSRLTATPSPPHLPPSLLRSLCALATVATTSAAERSAPSTATSPLLADRTPRLAASCRPSPRNSRALSAPHSACSSLPFPLGLLSSSCVRPLRALACVLSALRVRPLRAPRDLSPALRSPGCLTAIPSPPRLPPSLLHSQLPLLRPPLLLCSAHRGPATASPRPSHACLLPSCTPSALYVSLAPGFCCPNRALEK